jgi:NAD-dependent deacetylase
VPLIADAQTLACRAVIFVVIGTALTVYPAAGLLDEAPPRTPVYFIDPAPVRTGGVIRHLQCGASEGVSELARLLGGTGQ